jgi:hypothetical protein
VAKGGEILPTEEAAKEFGNACKVHRCIQVSPERESARGFFFACMRRRTGSSADAWAARDSRRVRSGAPYHRAADHCIRTHFA